MLWCRNPVNAQKMQQDRVNEKYLPGIKFKDTLTVSCSLEEVVRASKNVLVVVPSHTFADVLTARLQSGFGRWFPLLGQPGGFGR